MGSPIQDYQKQRMTLLTFIEKHRTIFDTFFEMVDQYNGSIVEAKQYVRDIEPDGPVNEGPFKRNKTPISTSYAPGKLPAAVLLIPGVIKAVDTAALEKLILAGSVRVEDVMDAKTVSEGTAAVSGPAPLVVKL